MAEQGTTLIFHFPHGLGPAEARVMASTMAELIQLKSEDATWRYSIEGSPEQSYAMGVATVELMGELAKLEAKTA
jgi:hypothetical protein